MCESLKADLAADWSAGPAAVTVDKVQIGIGEMSFLFLTFLQIKVELRIMREIQADYTWQQEM